jgi:hypothetical protein
MSNQPNMSQTNSSQQIQTSRASANFVATAQTHDCTSMAVYPTIRCKKLRSILDTGSTRTIISTPVWESIKHDQELNERRDVTFETVNGPSHEVFVADMNKDCILGLDFMNQKAQSRRYKSS